MKTPLTTVLFQEDFKQYKKDQFFKISNFTILTGENGTGKSNFLRGISSGKALFNHQILHPSEVVLYDHSSLNAIPGKIERGIGIRSNDSTLERAYRQHQAYLVNKTEPIPGELMNFSVRIGKSCEDITRDDFVLSRVSREIENIELFKYSFFEDTGTYLGIIEKNDFNEFRNEKYGDNNLVYTADELEQMYDRPPWVILNEYLERVDFKYRFYAGVEYMRSGYMKLELYDTVLKRNVLVSDLSSGETIVFLFLTSIYDSLVASRVPKVFLFDEVDALLHPSYCGKILNVIEDVIVNHFEASVIMVTHSPATVALAAEENIYVIDRLRSKIRRQNKDRALALLTREVNSISVSHDNRRQVFVEDEDDFLFHNSMFNHLLDHLAPEIHLHFMAVNKVRQEKTGGSSKVKSIVNELYNYGNKTTYGIIDHDNKNHSSNRVIVPKERYSIENYIFDPVFILALVLREQLDYANTLGFPNGFRYTDLERLGTGDLQRYLDTLFQLMGVHRHENNSRAIKYYNQVTVLISNDFLTMQGHALEELIIKTFPKVNSLGKSDKHKRARLTQHIIQYIINDLRGFISMDLVDVYARIQDQNAT